jgi:hypothetical protein
MIVPDNSLDMIYDLFAARESSFGCPLVESTSCIASLVEFIDHISCI